LYSVRYASMVIRISSRVRIMINPLSGPSNATCDDHDDHNDHSIMRGGGREMHIVAESGGKRGCCHVGVSTAYEQL
jgi:hypothetical protein